MFSSLNFQLQQLNASHSAELATTRKTKIELQDRLQSMTSEMLQLKSTVMEVSTERDGLKEHLRCHIQSKRAKHLSTFIVRFTDSFLGMLFIFQPNGTRFWDTICNTAQPQKLHWPARPREKREGTIKWSCWGGDIIKSIDCEQPTVKYLHGKTLSNVVFQ